MKKFFLGVKTDFISMKDTCGSIVSPKEKARPVSINNRVFSKTGSSVLRKFKVYLPDFSPFVTRSIVGEHPKIFRNS
jgi:hypothetical protein